MESMELEDLLVRRLPTLIMTQLSVGFAPSTEDVVKQVVKDCLREVHSQQPDPLSPPLEAGSFPHAHDYNVAASMTPLQAAAPESQALSCDEPPESMNHGAAGSAYGSNLDLRFSPWNEWTATPLSPWSDPMVATDQDLSPAAPSDEVNEDW